MEQLIDSPPEDPPNSDLESEAKLAPEWSQASPEQIEQEYVEKTYQVIASQFSRTRTRIWPEVEKFLLALPPYQLVADIGCGNGKNFEPRNQARYLGLDLTREFLVPLQARGEETLQSNALQLPFRSQSVDATLHIAVLHHLASPERRRQVVSELVRITRPGGQILITVWALVQPKTSRRQFEAPEELVGWRLLTKGLPPEKAPLYQRYYHLFVPGELEELTRGLPVEVTRSFEEEGNYGVILTRQEAEPETPTNPARDDDSSPDS